MVHFDFAGGGVAVDWKLGAGWTPQVSFSLPSGAIRANDASGPWIGIVSRDASCMNLIHGDAWYRATIKRRTGFVWVDGNDAIELGGNYDMVMVPNGGSHGDEIGRVAFNAVAAASAESAEASAKFKVFDTNGDGQISRGELHKIIVGAGGMSEVCAPASIPAPPDMNCRR